MQLISEGNSDREIAEALHYSFDNIKSILKNILNKLGARNRTHAVTIGFRKGIIIL